MVRSLPGRPFLRKIDISRFQAKFRFWPPPDASPVISIEPWGKQFFTYNTVKDVELRSDPRASDWGSTRPTWWREETAVSMVQNRGELDKVLELSGASEEEMNRLENQTHTTLCVTDFRKRPLFYMTSAEFGTLRAKLAEFKEQLAVYRSRVRANEAAEVERINTLMDDDKYLHIRRGRIMNPPQRSGRGVMSSPNRPPKRKPTTS